MSREIKLRAWDKKAKEMSPVFSLFGEFMLLGAIHEWQAQFRSEGDSLGRLNDLEVMQFTGLKDKNDKEIYENDIIKHMHINSSPMVVLYDNLTASFKVAQDEYFMGLLASRATKEIEVIGNLFQDRHLLSKE